MSRLLDAHFDVRLRFTANGVTQIFSAKADATRQAPIVVTFESDNCMKPNPPGGKIILESWGSIFVDRQRVPKLTSEAHAEIEQWLSVKRRQLEESAELALASGAKAVEINEDGEVQVAL